MLSKPHTTDPELVKLIAKVKGYKMSPAEIKEQRISFAYGNASFEDETITKEMVRKLDDEIYGIPK